MNTLTKKELSALGAVFSSGLFDAAWLNGSIYSHEPNDYQAGNHDDYKLFRRIVSTDYRDPFHGGVRYFNDGGIVYEMEYPTDWNETMANNFISEHGFTKAKEKGIFVYLLGSCKSLEG